MRRSTLGFLALVILIVSLAQGPLRACLWDSDTLAKEAQGVPDVIPVITGRFERNPPLYYEMRLKRADQRIRSAPDDRAAYDDAGVACDRLGRGDEAIAWMERKRERLDQADPKDPKIREQRYHYLANAGTFWVHRWARGGADRDKIAEVKTARDFIAQAIELNPDAHFGREKYQLKALDWIVEGKRYDPQDYYSQLPTFIEFKPGKESTHEAVRGLTGLIVLGNAWESVDVFNALVWAISLDGQRTSVAYLAMYRCQELVELGRKSLMPDAPTGGRLRDLVARPFNMPEHEKDLEATYRALRQEAETWHQARTNYMMARLSQGRHPDTDPTFWNEYRASLPPNLKSFESLPAPAISMASRVANYHRKSLIRRSLLIIGVTAVAVLAILLTLRQVRARPAY